MCAWFKNVLPLAFPEMYPMCLINLGESSWSASLQSATHEQDASISSWTFSLLMSFFSMCFFKDHLLLLFFYLFFLDSVFARWMCWSSMSADNIDGISGHEMCCAWCSIPTRENQPSGAPSPPSAGAPAPPSPPAIYVPQAHRSSQQQLVVPPPDPCIPPASLTVALEFLFSPHRSRHTQPEQNYLLLRLIGLNA